MAKILGSNIRCQTYHSARRNHTPEIPILSLTSKPRLYYYRSAGWSSLVARWAHNPKVEGSNPSPATIQYFTFPKQL